MAMPPTLTRLTDLLLQLADQGQALDNARSAATELSRRRVERVEVDLFLAELAARRASRTA